jgi:signal transduction histidine kinase
VTDKARELVEADAAALCLLSPSEDQLLLRASSGPRGILGTAGAVPLTGYKPDLRTASLELFQGDVIRAHLPTELRRAGLPIGVLVVASTTAREFGAEEHEVVSALATQAAIAIENARLYEEVQRLAIVEERRRLAQEMHDGVAQTIGLLNVKLRHFQAQLPQIVLPAAAEAIQEITHIAELAYDEARQSIFGLRAMVSRRSGVVPMLTDYVDDFRMHSGIDVALDHDPDVSIQLPPTVEAHVIRIVQEALSNVRRHSGAQRAWVRLRRDEECTFVTVEDNGHGWDQATPQRSARMHFGLQTMRERAQSFGGTLNIDTAPGQGTRVTVRVPVEDRR